MAFPLRIVITGCTRGLGRAMFAGFEALGHGVCGCGRKPAGNDPRIQAVDVADDASVAAWARDLLAEGGPPDLLINNAAMINPPRPLWEIPAAEFDRLVDVNIKGVANVLRHFAPAMIARGRGVIVNFSSGWGRSTSPGVAPYCASKYAIEGLSSALAQELPRGMCCVALNPGIIDTDMLRESWEGDTSGYPAPAEWARQAVPFLLSLGPKHNGRPQTVPGIPD